MRMKGEPLPNREADAGINAVVNALIPTEEFPFARREFMREALRKQVERIDPQPEERRPDMLFGDYRA